MWNSADLNTRNQVNTQLQYNIIVNNEQFGFQQVFDPTVNDPQFITDNNLYYANGWGKNGGILKDGNQRYATLAEVQTNTPWEMNSIEGNPAFIQYDYELEQQVGEQGSVDFHLSADSAALRQDILFLPTSLQTLVDQFNIEPNFVQNIGAFEHFYTPGLAFLADNQPIETNTYFSSLILTELGQEGDDLSVTSTENLTITTEMLVDVVNVGQPVNIVMVGAYTPPAAIQPLYFTRQNLEWQAWDGQLNTLAVAEEIVSLPKQQAVTVYQGNFAGILGEFVVYVGYQLPTGTIVFNGQRTIRFKVE
jgi:hypothetical protein